MTPARIAIGLLIAVVRAAVINGRCVLVALVLSVAMLSGCVSAPETGLRSDGALPLQSDPPVSALRMYEAGIHDGIEMGRAQALDDLRANPVMTLQSRDVDMCPNKVSWVDRFAGEPTWDSREESFRLYEKCLSRDHYKTRRLREIHQAIEQAK